jgi:hypothetical protein
MWDRAVGDAKRLCAAVRRCECQAYQFADSFDHYNSAALMYEAVSGTITYSPSFVRFAAPAGLPGQGAQMFGWVRKNMKSNQATFIIFVSVLFPSLGNSGSIGNPFITVEDAGNSQWSLAVSTSGALNIINGHSGAIQAASSPGLVAPNQWYGIEVTVSVGTGSGTAVVSLGGTVVINATGLNTQATSNAYGNQVAIGDINNANLNKPLFDDFRVWDNTGSTQNAAIGTDRRQITKVPSGPGTNTNWTPNGAVANWQCVDDNPPDGDTTYVSSGSTIVDDYAMPSAGLSVAPSMVVAKSYARKDDSATRALEVGVLSGSATSFGSPFTMSSTYAFVDACIPLDPNTSAAWTAAGADAAHHAKFEST